MRRTSKRNTGMYCMHMSIGRRRLAVWIGTMLFLSPLAGCGDDESPTTPVVPTGELAVTTETTGEQIDPNGYEIFINGFFVQAVDVDDSVLLAGVRADLVQVELNQVAGNCVVEGENPRGVSVPADDTASTGFVVACIATSGTIEVVTATTGADLDFGYVVTVDGILQGIVAANDTFRSASFPSGEHTVTLGDVAPNCLLAGDPERTVTVPAEEPAQTIYSIFCTDEVGDLQISTRTTGEPPDPDGYQVAVELSAPIALGANDTVTISSVAAGQARITLLEASLEAGCELSGSNPRSVTITAGATAATEFEVACGAP